MKQRFKGVRFINATRLSDKYINARVFIQNVINGSTNEKAALRCT